MARSIEHNIRADKSLIYTRVRDPLLWQRLLRRSLRVDDVLCCYDSEREAVAGRITDLTVGTEMMRRFIFGIPISE